MAKNKFESNEEVVAEEVALTEEQHLLIAALESDNVVESLSVLKDDEGTTERLAQLITVYVALHGALGDEAGATINAHKNLVTYKPAKVKAVKKPKAPKEPKFNERKALIEALDTDTLSTLIDDERISEELKNAIITYTTLRGLDLPEAIINAAKATLASFGKGSKGGTSGPRQTFGVEVNGVVYATLTSAIAAQGIEKIITGENKSDDADIAWRTIRPRLVKDGIANYNDATYTKVDSPVAATVEA
jgi:hypothetical protein